MGRRGRRRASGSSRPSRPARGRRRGERLDSAPPMRFGHPALRHNLPSSSPASSGASRSWPSVTGDCSASDAPGHADRRRRARQDAAGAAGRGRACWTSSRTASGWSSWPRWPTRRWCPQAVAAALGVREQPGRPLLGDAGRRAARRGAAAGAGQLRAPGRRRAPRWPTRCCAPAPDLRILATSREALGVAGETRLARAVARRCPLPRRADRRRAGGPCRSPRRCGCSSSGRRPAQPGFALDRRATRRRWRRSAAGWTASRWRSSWRRRGCGRCRVEQIAARLDDRFRLLTGGSRTAPAAPADAAGADRLELRPAGRAGAGAAAPAGGLRRRLDAGGGRGGLRRRRPRGAARCSTCSRSWWTSRWWWSRRGGRRGALPAAGDGAPVRGGAAAGGRRGGGRAASATWTGTPLRRWRSSRRVACAGSRQSGWRGSTRARQRPRRAGLEPDRAGLRRGRAALDGRAVAILVHAQLLHRGAAMDPGSAVDLRAGSWRHPREGRCSSARGRWRCARGQHGTAEALLRESLARHQELGNRRGEAESVTGLGFLALDRSH